MRRIETLSRRNTFEIGQAVEPLVDMAAANSERTIRAGIVQISGFRSGRSSIVAAINSERAHKATIHNIRGERRSRGGGGRCRAAAEHAPDRCPGSRHYDRGGTKLRSESVNQTEERTQRPRVRRVEVSRRSSFVEDSSKSSAKAKPQAA